MWRHGWKRSRGADGQLGWSHSFREYGGGAQLVAAARPAHELSTASCCVVFRTMTALLAQRPTLRGAHRRFPAGLSDPETGNRRFPRRSQIRKPETAPLPDPETGNRNPWMGQTYSPHTVTSHESGTISCFWARTCAHGHATGPPRDHRHGEHPGQFLASGGRRRRGSRRLEIRASARKNGRFGCQAGTQLNI